MCTTTSLRRGARARVGALAGVLAGAMAGSLACAGAAAQSASPSAPSSAAQQASQAASSMAAHYGFGSEPTKAELERFVSPLPDGRGLPGGSGSVEQGKQVYESTCLVCHGDKLQGGPQGDRLVGGRGTLVNDDPRKAPVKTVESYWPYATTLFDFIKRAMPLTAPGSLSNDEVYAVTAYILAQAKIVDGGTVLDANNLAKVQMPNRDGFVPDPRPENFPAP